MYKRQLNYLSGEVLGSLNIANTSGTVTANALDGTNNLTVYSLEIGASASFTAPAGTLTVTGAIGSSNAVNCDDEGTFIHSNGTVDLSSSVDQFMRGTNMNVAWGSAGAGVGFYNLTTSGSTGGSFGKQIRDCDVNVVNNLVIGSGTTFSNEGVNNSLTVTKHIDLTGTLNVNAAGTMSTGTMTLRDTSTLTNTGTITVTGNDKANSPTGSGYNWRNMETDGTAFVPSAGTVHFVGTGIANGYIVESRFFDFIFDITGGGDIQWLDADNNTMTIGGDCTIVEGQLKRNAESDTLVVTGDVSIESGGRLGDDDDTGPNTFGSLTIASGGTYSATSGTTTIKSATGTSSNTLSNSGTFTHNNGKLYFDLSVANGDGYHNILNSSTAGLHTFYDFEIKCDAEYVAMMKSIEVLGNYTVSGANAIRYESGNNTKTIIVHGLATTSNGQLGSADTTGLDTTIPLEKRGWQFLGGLDVTGGTLKLGSNQTVKVSGLRNIGGTIT